MGYSYRREKRTQTCLDADGFIRSEQFCANCEGIDKYCYKPFIISDETMNLGEVIKELRREKEA